MLHLLLVLVGNTKVSELFYHVVLQLSCPSSSAPLRATLRIVPGAIYSYIIMKCPVWNIRLKCSQVHKAFGAHYMDGSTGAQSIAVNLNFLPYVF